MDVNRHFQAGRDNRQREALLAKVGVATAAALAVGAMAAASTSAKNPGEALLEYSRQIAAGKEMPPFEMYLEQQGIQRPGASRTDR